MLPVATARRDTPEQEDVQEDRTIITPGSRNGSATVRWTG
jgi:hypothetical protein